VAAPLVHIHKVRAAIRAAGSAVRGASSNGASSCGALFQTDPFVQCAVATLLQTTVAPLQKETACCSRHYRYSGLEERLQKSNNDNFGD
jgi:hypothetical protein